MKIKHLLVAVVFLTTSMSLTAQEQGDISVFAGLQTYSGPGTFSGSAKGILVGGEYSFTDNISVAPSYVSYSIEGASMSEFNVNGHYYFSKGDAISWYGLAGVKFLSFGIDGFGSASTTGFQAGAGGVYQFSDSLGAFLQAMYSMVDGSNGTHIGLGVKYSFDL